MGHFLFKYRVGKKLMSIMPGGLQTVPNSIGLLIDEIQRRLVSAVTQPLPRP